MLILLQMYSDFNFFFKVENLKLMDGNYDVDISSKNISHLKSTNKDIEYWVVHLNQRVVMNDKTIFWLIYFSGIVTGLLLFSLVKTATFLF